VRGLAAARASASRPAVSSAAHRVLSLARMVGAEDLSAAAADLQDFAEVYSDAELGSEIEALGRQARDLRRLLAGASKGASVNPSSAS